MFGGFCWPNSFDRSLLSNVGRYQIIYRLPNASLWVPVALLEIPQACIKISRCYIITAPDSKVHGAKMGPIWGRQDPGGPHVGPMNFAIWGSFVCVWQRCKASCMYIATELPEAAFSYSHICSCFEKHCGCFKVQSYPEIVQNCALCVFPCVACEIWVVPVPQCGLSDGSHCRSAYQHALRRKMDRHRNKWWNLNRVTQSFWRRPA